MKKMGIECTVVDPDASLEELNKAFKENTKCVFAETLANPALVVLDIEKFAMAAHGHQVPLIVDNTFATPVNCNPFQWGSRYCNSFHDQIHGRTCNECRRRNCRLR